MLNGAKHRAKVKGLEFNLCPGDIKIPLICPVLNIALQRGKIKPGDNTPSLDRIDNTKGYIKGNVRVISMRANVLKRDATAQELIALAL